MNPKDINFIQASQFSEHTTYRYEVTLSKNKCLFFGKEVIKLYNLNVGLFNFYLDPPNNIIGWTIVDRGDLSTFKATKGKGVKRLNMIGKSGGGTINIAIELRKMNLDLKKIETKKHSVKTHKPTGLLKMEHKIDYISLDEYSTKK
ncbi:MAG: hypothetical protein Q7K40_03850 [bacterium]|nr:hypothetical protein [bacterium]